MVNSLFRPTTKTTKSPHYLLFAMAAHWRQMNSHYKSFPCHGVIIKNTYNWVPRGVISLTKRLFIRWLFRITRMKRQRLLITARSPSNTYAFTSHRTSDVNAFPCYDVNFRGDNLPLSFNSLLSGDLYTSLNWMALYFVTVIAKHRH